VDFSVAYYNSKHQVRAMLARVQGLISDVTARDWREPAPQLSQLARDCRNGQPCAIRDRLAPEEYERLIEAARAGACKKCLAAEYGISRRSIDRLSRAVSEAAT
jgi:hypothetical protein